MISLSCPVKNYEWGKAGSDSCVGRILKNQGIPIDESKPYAELWMGTHKSAASCIQGLSPDLDGHPLTDLFASFPEFIGDMDIHHRYGAQLPFLFKVLSIGKPLSIQVHPDKKLARQLFQSRPENYPDPNHKPEMAIALTPFTALAYFRPHGQIIAFIERFQPLQGLVGTDSFGKYKNANHPTDQDNCLKECFIHLLQSSTDSVAQSINNLLKQYSSVKEPILVTFKEMVKHFPNDVGTLACFFLNQINLEPGQALFIDVNQPHCYLSGDCVEIMACSDNVIRAGLTPKFKDVDLLCKTMTYSPKPIKEILVQPKPKADHIVVYSPPVDEFVIEKIEINPKSSKTKRDYQLDGLHSATLMIVIECESAVINSIAPLKKGNIFFLPPGLNYTLTEVKGKFLAFRAFIGK